MASQSINNLMFDLCNRDKVSLFNPSCYNVKLKILDIYATASRMSWTQTLFEFIALSLFLFLLF